MGRAAYYPMFADVRGRRCVVVGGGTIAERKAAGLLRCGAEVVVVSPSVRPWLKQLASQGRLRHVARRFRPSDLRGAWLAYAATDDQAVNEAVFRGASRARVWTNVVDQQPLCSFIAPAIMRRGDLVIAVSTGGASPTVAKWVRREVQRTVGAEYARLTRVLAGLREPAKRRLPAYGDRRRFFDRLVRGRVMQLVRKGRVRDAQREAAALLAKARPTGRASSSEGQ